jgi:hypothetical protein
MSEARTGPPPEKEAAAPVGQPGQRRDFQNSSCQENTTTRGAVEAQTIDCKDLWKLVSAVMRRGELRRYVPKTPAWCRRIGEDVWLTLMLDHDPDPTEIQLLLDAHARATARRDHERDVAEKERAVRALARRYMRGEHVPANALSQILGEPRFKCST